MFNEFIIFLFIIVTFMLLITLFNYKNYIYIFINIEIIWLFFFFLNTYVVAFNENVLHFYLNLWILLFSTCELIVLIILLHYFRK